MQYRQVPWDEYEKQAGPDVTKLYRWIEEVGYHVDIPVLRQESPHLMGFERWLQTRWPKALAA